MGGANVSAREAGLDRLAGIYLNDHLAGASGGLELFRRAARSHRGTPAGEVLQRLTAEVAADRDSLLSTMRALGLPVRRYKIVAGWTAEKAGRLKLNGRLLRRSPLSSLVELEALRLGVEGKASGWSLLLEATAADERLDARELERLRERARRQSAELESLRLAAGAPLFAT